MKTQDTNPANQAVTGNFTLAATLPNGKNFTVSGYLFDGESVDSVNHRIDLLHDVLDRQRTRAEIPELEAKRENYARQVEQMQEHLGGLHAKQAEGKALTSQEKEAIKNIAVSLSKAQEEIGKGTKAIAEAKAKVGVA
jgi:chromosome segregation ATPase